MKTPSAVLPQLPNGAPGSADSEVPFSALHEKAKWRKRRIIQNNDGGEARVPQGPIRAREDLLALRATPLIGSQVDTIIYDTTAGSFGVFAHDTKVGEPFLTTAGRYRYNALPNLLTEGTDPLKLMVGFARANAMEIIWTMRMNDTHDASNPLLVSSLKKEHPEWLLSSGGVHQVHGKPTSVDFGQEGIRRMAYLFVEEVVERYDINGVQLDFFRHPVFFKSASSGGRATDEDRTQMSELIRQIRRMTYDRGEKRGVPLLLSIRIPDSMEYCYQIGLDIETWLSEGLVDFISTTCYFRLNPWSYSVALGERFNVPVYPCLSESRIAADSKPWSDRKITEVYRARAANIWHAGANGVYLFNAFDGAAPWWREIGSPETLIGLDKRYFATVRSGDYRNFLSSDISFEHGTPVSPNTPKILSDDELVRFSIETAEDFRAASLQGKEATVQLRLDIRPLPEPQLVQVTLNDVPLSDSMVVNDWLVFPVEPNLLNAGMNEITIRRRGVGEDRDTSRSISSAKPGNGITGIEQKKGRHVDDTQFPEALHDAHIDVTYSVAPVNEAPSPLQPIAERRRIGSSK